MLPGNYQSRACLGMQNGEIIASMAVDQSDCQDFDQLTTHIKTSSGYTQR